MRVLGWGQAEFWGSLVFFSRRCFISRNAATPAAAAATANPTIMSMVVVWLSAGLGEGVGW
jgi:hypothetical protein